MIRFAIRAPEGDRYWRKTGSPGWVPLQKATLWNSRAHVVSHLRSIGFRHPTGSAVVEIEIREGAVLGSTDDLVRPQVKPIKPAPKPACGQAVCL